MGLGAHGLTRQQDALVNAALDPTCKTVTEAGRRAGYKHLESSSRALRSAEVQRAIEARKAEQGDSARSIRKKSLGKASVRLDSVDSPHELMQIAVMAATVEEKVGLEEEVESPRACLDQWNDKMRRLVRAIYGHALAGRTCPWVQDMVSSEVGVRDGTLCQPEIPLPIDVIVDAHNGV
jgi:hypothetical protein